MQDFVTLARRALLVWLALMLLCGAWPWLPVDWPGRGRFGPFGPLTFAGFVVLTVLAVAAKPAGRDRGPYENWTVAILIVSGMTLIHYLLSTPLRPRFRQAFLLNHLLAMSVSLIALLPLSRFGFSRAQCRIIARWGLAILLPIVVTISVWPGFTFRHGTRMVRVLRVTSQVRPDHLGHLLISAVITWLALHAQPFGRRRPTLNVVVILTLMLLSAPLIEWAQSWSDRGVEWSDQFWHLLGVGIAVGGYTLVGLNRSNTLGS